MLEKHIILGVHITDRLEKAAKVQEILTEGGQHIKTRLGLHEVDGVNSSKNGVLILEMVGDEAACLQVGEKLGNIEGVEVQKMVFDHP